MKILHGHLRTTVRVKVDDENATPENPRGHERVKGHGYFDDHGDATFSVDPDGTLYIYGDRSKPAHHSYGRNAWLWVGDENDNSVFNTAHDRANPKIGVTPDGSAVVRPEGEIQGYCQDGHPTDTVPCPVCAEQDYLREREAAYLRENPRGTPWPRDRHGDIIAPPGISASPLPRI